MAMEILEFRHAKHGGIKGGSFGFGTPLSV